MSDPADLESLARRFLDLWQEQVSAAAGDAATAEMIQRLAEASAAAPAAWLALWTQAAAKSQHGDPHASQERSTRPEAPGAATSRPASVDRGSDLAELVERVERLERRLAELEPAAGAARPRPTTRRRARKRES